MLACGPFWPDLDLNHFRDSQRIGGTLIPETRVADALMGGVIAVDRELQLWRAKQELAGFTTLATIPSPAIGAETRLMRLWRRAVFAYATADLVETHRDVTATGTGQAAGAELDQRAEDHRRNATHAIRDILGKTRTTVDLI
ncbi:head completion/stabilization protein [Altericroceibacterium endophyticum]|uniref:Head completion/stabilization protein n=1 Tax=Altericroceibacterium endophyticum TaxID=1808508 RepID=A0A6I4T8N7_9SPHN|nr:head completion/stabilization protein [Altericroceibacterium endophyticum]MXO66240.1 hypothetical protein [Altericroceibacterium endophyticum]